MKKQILLLPIIFFTFFIKASQEINTINEVLNYIQPKKSVLVIFDIDNTLLEAPTDLGSDQWFSYHFHENIKKGMDTAQAIKQILPLYFHINFIIDLIPTEPTLVNDIAGIKNNCDHVICLTARSLSLVVRTLQQLDKNQLYFQVPELGEFKFNLMYPNLYKHGVLFCGLNCKGKVLSAFLDVIDYVPDMIIFIDDKETNLVAVECAVKNKNIEFIGLRYAGCDERVYNFKHEKTEYELQEFLMQHPFIEDQTNEE